MRQRILSVTLAFCLCVATQSVAHAWQKDPLPQEDVLADGSTDGSDTSDDVITVSQEGSSPQEDSPMERSAAGLVTRDNIIPTPTEVYEAMIALKDQEGYKEGTTWTNYEPYPDTNGDYKWKGGPLNGSNISAVGCVAFAFILSDAAFGELPARMYAAGEFTYEDIKVGDILRVSNDAHTVIVLEVSDAGVVIAEGNNNSKVHWGRAISKEDVLKNTDHYITRYPEGYISPNDPEANESIGSGTLEGGLAWNLTKAGTLTISGSGAMPDLSSATDQEWSQNSGKIRKVVIGEGVTNIGSCSFWDCGVLSVEIPSSVTTIGNSAFRGSSIIAVSVPSSVETIGDNAFYGCPNLSSVIVSEGVRTIEQNAFRACTSLTSIALPSSIEKVGAAAFFQCGEMMSATFAPGNNQVELGDNLFTQCYKLMRVTLPSRINCIGEGMFQNCLMLTDVEISQGAQSIGGSAFASSALTTVVIPDSVTTIGIAAFSSCPLTDIYFTGSEAQWKSVRKIGDTESAVLKVTMHYDHIPTPSPEPSPSVSPSPSPSPGVSPSPSPSPDVTTSPSPSPSVSPSPSPNPGVTTSPSPKPDGDGGNNDSTSDNNTDDSTSDNNTDGSTSDNDTDGSNGDNNTDGSENDDNDNDSDTDDNDDDTDDESRVPIARGKTFTTSKITYKVTKVGKEVELTTSSSAAAKVTVNTVTGPDGVVYKVTSIKSKALQGNKKMTRLTIGANVKTIKASAFSGCTKLTTVVFGKNVATIGASAFKGCTALRKTLTLPDSVKTIGESAFSGCDKITAVTIGKTSRASLTTIGKSALKGCKRLNKVTIRSKKLASVGKQTFKGTGSKLKVKVPSRQLTKYRRILKKAGLKTKQITK